MGCRVTNTKQTSSPAATTNENKEAKRKEEISKFQEVEKKEETKPKPHLSFSKIQNGDKRMGEIRPKKEEGADGTKEDSKIPPTAQKPAFSKERIEEIKSQEKNIQANSMNESSKILDKEEAKHKVKGEVQVNVEANYMKEEPSKVAVQEEAEFKLKGEVQDGFEIPVPQNDAVKSMANSEALEEPISKPEIKEKEPNDMSNPSFPQEPNKPNAYRPPSIDKPKLESIISKAPTRTSTTLTKLCDFLKTHASDLSEEEKAWLAFRWMALNIAYDSDGFFSGNYGDLSPEGVFKSGKGVCSGYARLYQHISKQLGVETVCINGYAKGVGYNSEVSFKDTNHEWNAVKLHETWYLIDSTWGAGYLNGSTFKREYIEYYFCPDPSNLIRSHYPKEGAWQLLDPIVSKAEFEALLKYDAFFYECGLVSTEPDKAVITAEETAKFKIYFKPTADARIMASLSSVKGDRIFEGGTFVQKLVDHYEVDVIFNNKGKHKLQFYAGTKKMNNYSSVFNYTITCTKVGEGLMKFPQQFPTYAEVGAVLYSPKIGPLKVGENVKFKIQAEKAEEIAVVIGEQWTHLQKVNGVFEGEAKVVSKEVNVYYKNAGMGSYSGMLSYEVN
eukprot:TRINITY_DN1540_c0_g1_i1.p1 TRINITY_DN1540_c0_g1~~TRINITY_DN1540_c0_g1_i1.p1  ORF type:complete len:614 (-),score=102.86 TRINITY_DN1540_c0_g1_i1:74-1915(-)